MRGLERISTRPEGGPPVPGLLVVRVMPARPCPDGAAGRHHRWFAARGWAPRAHQLDLLAKGACRALDAAHRADRRRQDARRLPAEPGRVGPERYAREARGRRESRVSAGGIRREGGLHTLYISPLKALAVDIARNLEAPVEEMGLPIRIETRTGDTPRLEAPAAAATIRPTSC